MAGFHPELFLNTLGGNLDRIDGVRNAGWVEESSLVITLRKWSLIKSIGFRKGIACQASINHEARDSNIAINIRSFYIRPEGFRILLNIQGWRNVFCIVGANKQAPEALTCTGFWRNSLPENFEILKLGNATFSILGKISKK